MSKIAKCTCKSEYQDAKYGHGMRVHNLGKGKEKAGRKAKCTVCGNKVDA